MVYQVEFIRRVPGRAEPEILQRANMEAATLDLVKAQARALFDATKQANPMAEGYQIVENGAAVVYHWHRGDNA